MAHNPASSPGSAKAAPTGIYVRSTSDYLGWSMRLARHTRQTRNDAVAAGLLLLARESGFTEPPPARVIFPERAGRKVDPAPSGEAA